MAIRAATSGFAPTSGRSGSRRAPSRLSHRHTGHRLPAPARHHQRRAAVVAPGRVSAACAVRPSPSGGHLLLYIAVAGSCRGGSSAIPAVLTRPVRVRSEGFLAAASFEEAVALLADRSAPGPVPRLKTKELVRPSASRRPPAGSNGHAVCDDQSAPRLRRSGRLRRSHDGLPRSPAAVTGRGGGSESWRLGAAERKQRETHPSRQRLGPSRSAQPATHMPTSCRNFPQLLFRRLGSMGLRSRPAG